MASLGTVVKHPPAVQEMQKTGVQSLGQEDPLAVGMATPSSILAGKIPWTENPWWTMVHGVTKSQTGLQPLRMYMALCIIYDIPYSAAIPDFKLVISTRIRGYRVRNSRLESSFSIY